MNVSKELALLVEQRAAGRCEYCRMHQALQGATFHVEHILPGARGGLTIPENLAWACPGCNLHKSDRTESRDPDSGLSVPLINPRTQNWHEHFQIRDRRIIGLTPTGRATVAILDLNHPRRLLIRQAEELIGLIDS